MSVRHRRPKCPCWDPAPSCYRRPGRPDPPWPGLNVSLPPGVGGGGEGACPVPPQSWTSPGGPRVAAFRITQAPATPGGSPRWVAMKDTVMARAAVGRVGIAMTGLGLVWLLHARTGSYGTAGLAAAGFALAEALIGPQLARL